MTSRASFRSLTVTATAAVLIGLTGCSTSAAPTSSSSTSPISVPTTVTAVPTPTPSTSAVAGSISSSDKTFSLVAPASWTKVDLKQTTLAIKAPSPQDRVTTNFNVVVQSQQPVPTLDDVVSQAEIAWRQQGVTLTDRPDRTIGGLPARGYSLQRNAQGASFQQTQYFVVFREHIYSLTMSSSSSAAAAAAADQALDGILGTWSWQQS